MPLGFCSRASEGLGGSSGAYPARDAGRTAGNANGSVSRGATLPPDGSSVTGPIN
jgi:hypothetical protein